MNTKKIPVVNNRCTKCSFKYLSDTPPCARVCQAVAFHEDKTMLVINPVVCTGCGLCIPQCPFDAIAEEADPQWMQYNAEKAPKLPVVNIHNLHKSERKRQEKAQEAFERGRAAQRRQDHDTAVWEFFSASRFGFGDAKYHRAFANALLRRGLRPLEEKDAARAEELYQKANKTGELVRLDLWLQAALLGHLNAADKLRVDFIIATVTTPEGKALYKLLLKADYPPALCDAGLECYWYKGDAKNREKAFEYFEKAAALGYEPAAETIKNIKRREQQEIENAIAAKEFARQNPPLKGKEKKTAEDALAQFLSSSLSRKAARIVLEKRKSPPPTKQVFLSHTGGYPYFEKGSEWPCYPDEEEPDTFLAYSFLLQIFRDDTNSAALPEGVKLLQVFYDWSEGAQHIVLYRELHPENAVLYKNFLPRSLQVRYHAIKFETMEMVPDYYDAQKIAPEAGALSEKVHPGKGERVYNRLCKTLGLRQPFLDSYLGGYMSDMDNSSREQRPGKNMRDFFQIYLAGYGEGPFGWGRWDDAMLYAYYNVRTKKVKSEFVINYD